MAPPAGKPELELLRFKLRRARESQALIPGRNTDNKLVEHCRCLYYRSLQRYLPNVPQAFVLCIFFQIIGHNHNFSFSN